MAYNLSWEFKRFENLSTEELYQILRLRNQIFVVEQHCNYLDLDNKDQQCEHLMGVKDGKLVAYSRIVPAGLSYEYPSIGRIVVAKEGRGHGYGIELLNVSIQRTRDLYGEVPIQLGGQLYLKKFYESFGFVQVSDVYLEDQIEHIVMTRNVIVE